MGIYEKTAVKKGARRRTAPFWLLPVSFFLVELFAFFFLSWKPKDGSVAQLWPLAFGALWAVLLSAIVRLLPAKAGRIVYASLYGLITVYAIVQTGYYILFGEMMWLSDFRYASEGADYASVLLSYPLAWWLGVIGLIGIGVALVWMFPRWRCNWRLALVSVLLCAASASGAYLLPQTVFEQDEGVKYAGSDYGRAQSAQAAYENLFNTHRLYQVCGLYQTLCKDIYANAIYPLTPAYTQAHEAGRQEIDAYFAEKNKPEKNEMTGLLAGKNVVLVLMESMDDWLLGEYTPTLNRLMSEGINFTDFYTPVYGGIRTFNTEFCINTGSFLSSTGGYAFDYVTNDYRQSLAFLLREQGYSAEIFHYNTPTFYSRGIFSETMGYQKYNWYTDYLRDYTDEEIVEMVYDDQILFENEGLNGEFFREGKRLNFIITRAAHLSYKYNEALSHWGLKKYPEFKGLTGNEETDCAYLKAKLVDDLFARLMAELEEKGELENTVIIGVTDHYTYGYKNEEALLALSGVDKKLLLEKTPCFIWSDGLEPMEVDKVLNTSDVLPTVLNLLGIDSPYDYIGSDAFDERYDGFAPFSNGSWIYGDAAYDASTKKLFSIDGSELTVTPETRKEIAERVQKFTRINNLILDVDYYGES